MRIDEVKKLVSMLYDMELNNYMMSCCIKNLTETMSGLKKEKIISEPIYTITPFQDKEIKVGEIIKTCAMIGFFLGAVPGLITGCEDGDGSGGLDVIFSVPLGIINYGGIVGAIGGFLGMIIGSVLTGKAEKENKKNRKSLEIQDKKNHDYAIKKYNEDCRKEKERLENEAKLYNQLSVEKRVLEKQLTESENTLKQLYDDADIEPAYRNLVAIGYMNELISIEAATQLKGSNGLYYLVRKELRQDNLEGILNGISDKLNTIISQNNRLHSELMHMNQESVRLSGKILSELKETSKTQMEMNDSMRAIERNTRYSSYSDALTAYNTTRMRKELEYQTFLSRIR